MSEPTPLEAIFFAALEKAPGERAAFLTEACGGDASLRSRVDRMLAAQADAGNFLESPPSAVAVTSRPTIDQPPLERPGVQIGPYKLLQQIGEGGMGVVYMAEQSEPIARRVALKIIKPGMDTHQVIARFEAERQALALMDHPNIAKVLDAGTTGEPEALASGSRHPPAYAGGSPGFAGGSPGRPYFVMELVRGVPITQYSDENNLPTAERLLLFIAVCHAIQHAHQKGIIHRDIKPGNILVTLHDGVPVPKVVDFGIANARVPARGNRAIGGADFEVPADRAAVFCRRNRWIVPQ